MKKIANLDMAAYLMSLGFQPKVKAIHSTYGEFTFQDDPKIEKGIRDFLTGKASINLQVFLYNRTILKALNKKELGRPQDMKMSSDLRPYKLLMGKIYFYIDASDENKIKQMPFTGSQRDLTNIKTGNYYQTSVDAVSARSQQNKP